MPSTKDTTSVKKLLTIALVIVAGVFVAGWAYIVSKYPAATTAAEFGDQFGGLSALFSALAFAAVVVAIILQKRDLSAQLDDLELTRDVLKQQASTLQIQSFEHTFFELLRLHASAVAGLYLVTNKVEYRGSSCFKVWLQVLHQHYARAATEQKPEPSIRESAYSSFYEATREDLGRYFRSLKNILLFLDRADVEDKEPYQRAVRSQLTDSEMVLVLYHCELWARKFEFKGLVIKHSTIRSVDRSLLLHQDHQQFELAR